MSAASLYKRIDHHGNELDDENITDDMKARRKRLIEEANWDDLLFWDKFRLFDIWSVISMLANLS
jgi:hypothetical protein